LIWVAAYFFLGILTCLLVVAFRWKVFAGSIEEGWREYHPGEKTPKAFFYSALFVLLLLWPFFADEFLFNKILGKDYP